MPYADTPPERGGRGGPGTGAGAAPARGRAASAPYTPRVTATATSVDRTGQPATRAVPPGRRARVVRALLPAGAAASSGVLLYASFPPRTLWWLALPALAVFGWSLYGRGWKAGAGLGYLFGLGFLLPLLVWTGVEVGPGPWLALVAAEACFTALAGAAIAATSRLPGGPLWAAALWVAGEAARARVPFGGFPWGKVAFGQADGAFLPLAAVGGTPVLGFAVVLCGFGLGELVRQAVAWRRGRTWSRPAAVAALLAVVLPPVAAVAASPLVDDTAENGTSTVAVIQGNVPRAGLDFNAQRRAVLDHHVRETERLAADVEAGRVPRPDLVLWPENAADIDPLANPDARAEVDRAVRTIGSPVSVGGVVMKPDGRLYNEQILWDPRNGPTSTYDKRQIQPFGEFIPLRALIGLFADGYVSMVPQDFSRGAEPGVFTMAGARVGLVTCYEAAFDWTVRSTVRAGAQLISVPSNNATFDRSEMTYQQLAMSRIRAVEHSRTVAVPVTSGVSAVIRPDGRVVSRTELFTAASLVERVPLRSAQTPATRLGTLPEAVLVLVAAAGLGWAGTVAVRARRAVRPQAGAADGGAEPQRSKHRP